MLENTEYNHSRRRRSGFVRTNLSVDAKRRVYLTRRSRRGCGASGIVRGDWETGSDLESGDEESGVESIDLTDISRSFQSSRNLEVLCDDRNEGERMELDQSVDVDLPEREDTQTDSGEVSLSDFANLLEESQSIPLETSSSDADTEDISPCESVELTQEPDSTHVEQALNDTIELDNHTATSYPGKRTLSRRNC
jgi:hypothetical protein